MNVTGILRRSIRSKMGILAYAPGASICAVIPPSTVRNAGTWGLGLGELGTYKYNTLHSPSSRSSHRCTHVNPLHPLLSVLRIGESCICLPTGDRGDRLCGGWRMERGLVPSPIRRLVCGVSLGSWGGDVDGGLTFHHSPSDDRSFTSFFPFFRFPFRSLLPSTPIPAWTCTELHFRCVYCLFQFLARLASFPPESLRLRSHLGLGLGGQFGR